jgi:hypothetical protein
MANVQPNRYVLQSTDGKTKIDYETSNIAGQKTLNLTQGSSAIRHFSGSQIRAISTEVGTLISITTHLTVDTGSTSLSVLIPAITLTGAADHKTFNTEAIVTSHTGPDSVPSTGVHETYQFITCKGQANFVFTLVEPATKTAAQGG